MSEKNRKTEVQGRDILLGEHHEAGSSAEWRCPHCGQNVLWATWAWWEVKCSCGTWDFNYAARLYE